MTEGRVEPLELDWPLIDFDGAELSGPPGSANGAAEAFEADVRLAKRVRMIAVDATQGRWTRVRRHCHTMRRNLVFCTCVVVCSAVVVALSIMTVRAVLFEDGRMVTRSVPH